MSNPISKQLTTGTIGELLVQVRLLQYDVQAAPPLKDSGNDLIAVRGETIRTVQVKTTTGKLPGWPPKDKIFHLLAIVLLVGADRDLELDQTRIYLIPKERLEKLKQSWEEMEGFLLSKNHVDSIFK